MKITVETIVDTRTSPVLSRPRLTSPGFGLIVLLCMPLISLGQSSRDFSRLIFEPAILPQGEQQAARQEITENGPQVPQTTAATNEASAQAAPPLAGVDTPAEEPVEQTADDPILQNEIGRYEAALDTSLQSQDQYSPQLREQYEALGHLLQQNGEHERAVTMFQNAMQIDRVNTGLFTTLQIPLVKEIIESQQVLGDLEEVASMQGYLYYLHQKSFAADSEEFLAAKEAWADWNVESYLQEGGNGLTGNYAYYGSINSASRMNEYVPIQNPRTREFAYVPRSQLPFVLGPGSSRTITDLYTQSAPYAVTPEEIIDERLRTAEDLYEEILETRATRNPDVANSAVQHKLANIAYAVKRQMDVMESKFSGGSLGFGSFGEQSQPNMLVRRGYTKNLEALEAYAEKLENSPDASALDRANAYINLGDWNVSFDRAQRSEDAYAKAWQILRDVSFTDSEITAIFQPLPLVPVPAYVIHEFSRAFHGIPADAELAHKGYMDATVDLDRFGRLSNIRIDATSSDTPRSVRDTLLTYLREKKMRPAIANGELVKVSDVKTRYYYSYD